MGEGRGEGERERGSSRFKEFDSQNDQRTSLNGNHLGGINESI